MSIKLIVSDLDDSLLNEHSEISPRTEAALKQAMAAGAYVVLASGRMVEAMLKFAAQVGVNAPLIAYNGSMTYDTNAQKPVCEFPVSVENARAISRMAEEMGVYIQAFWGGKYYFPEHNILNERYGKSICPGYALHKPLSECIETPVSKLLMIGEPEEMTRLVPVFSEAFAGRVACAISRPIYIECVDVTANKRNALAALAENLKIAPEEILAFGDGQNDIGMLTYAGHGYAVANARPETLAAVPRHAESNAANGPAKIIEEYLAAGKIG